MFLLLLQKDNQHNHQRQHHLTVPKIIFTVFDVEHFFGNLHQNIQLVFFLKPENILYHMDT